MENKDWIGYIYSDSSCEGFVPQKVQNLVIRDFLNKRKLNYILSHTEFNFKSLYFTLTESLKIEESSRIVFYSTDLFPDDRNDLVSEIFKLIDSNKLTLAFALEEVIVDSSNTLREILSIKGMRESFSSSKQKADLSETKVRFRDLRVFDNKLRKEYKKALDSLLDTGKILNGDEISNFEDKISNYCNVKYSLGVSSGTDALYLALIALGIGKGDKVIVPCISWISTAHAVSSCGAEPIFADIKNDLTICESSVERVIDDSVKAIVMVHFMGNICAYNKINSIAKKYNLKVIEDCAQSFGAEIDNEKAGSFGDISCFSFNPMKNLSSLGEAGAICTNNKELYETVKRLRYCGLEDGQSTSVSLNFRMDSFQAAILSINFENLNFVNQRIETIYKYYIKRLSPHFKIITGTNDNVGSKYGFTLELENREKYMMELDKLGIENRIQHIPLMNEHKMYLDCHSDVYVGNYLKTRILNIPFHEKLDIEQIEYIVDNLIQIKDRVENG